MIDTDKYEVAYGKWSVGHEGQHDLPEGDIPINVNGGLTAIAYSQADAQLIADAPLLLAEVKRLRERLMLAESALGEVRACHEDGQGNLGEILEHYRDKEGVEMPNAFDEVIE